MFEMPDRSFRAASYGVERREIWVDRESGVGGAQRFTRSVRIVQVNAFVPIREHAVGCTRDRLFGVAEYFYIVIGLGACPPV